MNTNVHISCPHCERPDIRIKPEHLGLRVRCKYCGRAFVAQLPADPPDPPAFEESEGAAGPPASLEEVVRRIWSALETLAAEHASTFRKYEDAQGRLEQVGRQVRTLQEQLEVARQRSRHEMAERQGAELDHAARVGELEETTRVARARVEEMQAELESLRAAARRGDVLDARVRTLQDECERLRRDRNDQALEHLGALEALQRELDAARAELDAERGWAAGIDEARSGFE